MFRFNHPIRVINYYITVEHLSQAGFLKTTYLEFDFPIQNKLRVNLETALLIYVKLLTLIEFYVSSFLNHVTVYTASCQSHRLLFTGYETVLPLLDVNIIYFV